MSKTNVIEKIKKLLSLAQSNNEHEAKLAAERASHLMQKHQINMTQVDVDEQRESGVLREMYEGKFINRRWVLSLGGACAALFDCECLGHGYGKFSFIGFNDDIQAATELMNHLYKSWQSIVKHDAKLAKQVSGDKYSGASFRLSHGVGFAIAIEKRVRQLVKERKAEVQQTTVGTALIVMKDQEVSTFMSKIPTKKARPLTCSDHSGYSAGRSAGQNAAFGGAIETA